MEKVCQGCEWVEDWHSGGLISGLERSVRGQYWPPPAWATVVGQGRCWTGMIWGVGVTGCLLKRLALSFSRTPSRLPPSRKCLMRVVGPWDKGGGTLGMGSPSHPVPRATPRPAASPSCRQGAVPSQLWEVPSWAPGSAPWNVALRCGGGAARVASSPVLSRRVTSRLGRPEQPLCPGTPAAGGHQLSAGTEAASPAPRGTWTLAPQPCQGLALTA